MDLKNKVTVVTGGAQGVGKNLVEMHLKNGSKVAIIDVDKLQGEELKEALDKEYGPDRVEFFAADVSSHDEFSGAFKKIEERFGRIDIMYNNAGIINEVNWEKMVAVNLVGVIKGTYLALEHMKENNEGVIVNISSIAGIYGMPMTPVYTATQYAVVGFSRAIAAALKLTNTGMRINVICPGFVNTGILSAQNIEENIGELFKLKEIAEKWIERNGILDVDDVVRAALALVRDESKNGDVLKVTTDGLDYISFPELAC
ncbi:15-hydroxyprostaglandin dehydrogenase [NAD(+)]-like [Xyrauchen texanus]|uniref:15-hydroxyprostaglandin dehydrogenase [NAD(+)]-like n=1 Tax=Xyrauchen texanus TaxID=154827 RepID=UPI002241D67D|nr:15-hydroxyprostaglandin dehydrogenase [NAD(+)]-like [Xyrauchen texanus]